MGINFTCPSGHPVIAKESQAGKQAVCPECGARVTVPLQGSGQLKSSGPIDRRPTPPPPPKPADPIDESPGAQWYVTSGTQQYGPANGPTFRKWIAAGRVAADTLIWREGWDDWARAGTVFPVLNEPYESTPVEGPSETRDDAEQLAADSTIARADADRLAFSVQPTSSPQKKRRKVAKKPAGPVSGKNKSKSFHSVATFAGLSATVLVLAFILFWIVSRS
jgi:GYF domain 2